MSRCVSLGVSLSVSLSVSLPTRKTRLQHGKRCVVGCVVKCVVGCVVGCVVAWAARRRIENGSVHAKIAPCGARKPPRRENSRGAKTAAYTRKQRRVRRGVRRVRCGARKPRLQAATRQRGRLVGSARLGAVGGAGGDGCM